MTKALLLFLECIPGTILTILQKLSAIFVLLIMDISHFTLLPTVIFIIPVQLVVKVINKIIHM